MNLDGKWIKFVEGTPNKKTKTWAVVNKENSEEIGRIAWFSRWRKYSFFPLVGMVFEETCLKDIAHFIESASREHREKRKRLKEGKCQS